MNEDFVEAARRDELVARLNDWLERFRAGSMEAAELAQNIRSLVDGLAETDLSADFREAFLTKAKQLEKGILKPVGGELPWALSSLRSTLASFWGSGRRKLLYVSMRIGGESPQNADVIAAIRDLGRTCDRICPAPDADSLCVDLVFDIPGPILGVDYEGIRTGRLSRPMRMFQIQVAVPVGLSNDDIPSFLAEMLTRTAVLVREFMEPRKTGLSTEAVETVIRELAERVDG